MSRALAWVLAAYHRLLSPFLPAACRFHPTCSVYAAESFRRHGLWMGGRLALGRLLRCHPFSAGGLDPVPPRRGRRGIGVEA
ncbi:MAG TPA: membrane protein insertion efficiency factor YidD [Myxococcales bacterium]|nr:membrane protein insertion efficiency factor YidD [Myxococcales bacterium]